MIADVQQGLVSRDQASQVYGVVLRPSGEIDEMATEARRTQLSSGVLQ